MIKFCHTCRFSTLTINFSEVWPRQILDLEKQLNRMIRLENVLKTSLQDILKMPSKSLEDVFKTSWRCLEDFLKTFLQDVLKMFWRRLHQDKCLLGLLSQIIPRKLNFAFSSRELSWISTWYNNTNFNDSLFNSTALSMVSKLQTVLILELVLNASFENGSRFFYIGLLLMMAESNPRTLICN